MTRKIFDAKLDAVFPNQECEKPVTSHSAWAWPAYSEAGPASRRTDG
jgi:hypothetical protein